MPLRDNLIDLWRLFRPGAYRRDLYNHAYADKAEDHAERVASHEEIDWVAAHPAATRVLDIGCNTGRPLNRLCTHWNARGAGVDINTEAVQRAQSELPQYDFSHYAGAELPHSDGDFAHVMIHHVLGHVGDPALTLREAHRVLEPGGTLSIVTPNSQYKQWQGLLNLLRGFQPDVTVLRYYSCDSLEQALRDAGFQVETLTTAGVVPELVPGPWADNARLRVMAWARRV